MFPRNIEDQRGGHHLEATPDRNYTTQGVYLTQFISTMQKSCRQNTNNFHYVFQFKSSLRSSACFSSS
jgi:hypothetical protein